MYSYLENFKNIVMLMLMVHILLKSQKQDFKYKWFFNEEGPSFDI